MKPFAELTADEIDRNDNIGLAELKTEVLGQLLAMLDCPAGRASGAYTDINLQRMDAERRMLNLRANRYARPAYGRDEPTQTAFGARAGD